MKQDLFVITGQTGTGKTQVAIDLALAKHGAIISADARQAYKFLDVITGKDIGESTFHTVEMFGNFAIGYYTVQGIEIWLYDIVDPRSYFSAFDWAQCAKRVLGRISAEGKTPIITGGTYFYIETLLFGLTESSQPQWSVRQELEKKSVYELRKEAKEIDDEEFRAMNGSDQYNPRRLIRFIEKHRAGDSRFQQTFQGIASDYLIKYIGLVFESTEIARQTLTKRVEKRLEAGALSEIETLLAMRFTQYDPGLNTIGYKQLISHLAGSLTLAEAKEEWITKEVQYAKRQYTIMKRNGLIMWYTCNGTGLPNVTDMV